MAFFEWILLLTVSCALIFVQAPLYLSLALMAAMFVVFSFAGQSSIVGLFLLWGLFLTVSAVLTCSKVRRRFLTDRLYKKLQQVLPKMSETEREALEAGDVWWDQALFSGRPNWKQWFENTEPKLKQEERDFIAHQTETLCDMIDDWSILETGQTIPEPIMAYIKKEKFWALELPKQYGGLGFSSLAHSTIVQKISSRSISVAVSVMVPNSLGPGELLLEYGTKEQKDHYLPRLARGEEIPCFALTGPEAGSDAASMPDCGVVCRGEFEGKEVLGIRLNWEKHYITLAPIATVLGLAFKLSDPEQLLGGTVDRGITLCLIPTNHPGIDIGTRHNPLGMAFMNGPTRGKNVFVPLDWIIGGVDRVGDGWRMLMECLAAGRAISLPAIGTCGGKFSFRTAGAYAAIRRQFNTPIAQFEGIQAPLARIGGLTYLLESARTVTAAAIDQGARPSVVSAIIKYHATEINRTVLNDAMDIHGGKGIQTGPSNYLSAAYIAIPIGITVEGANILTRSLIIFGQGAIRCHPHVYKEMQALTDVDEAAGQAAFDRELIRHAGYKISHYVRTICFGLTSARLVCTPFKKGVLHRYCQQLTRMSSALALTSDMAMLILGGGLKRKEHLSARLGDVLSYLYLASCALKYYHDHGQSKEDLPLLHWSVQHCLHQTQLAFDDFFTNFPYAPLARLLRTFIFPWGRAFPMPKDQLSRSVVEQMVEPSAFRDRLTSDIYIGSDERSSVWRLEDVFERLVGVAPIEAKIKRAIKQGTLPQVDDFNSRMQAARLEEIITEKELEQLKAFEEARLKIISVDEFPQSYFDQITR